jgi:hypothetical protein
LFAADLRIKRQKAKRRLAPGREPSAGRINK